MKNEVSRRAVLLGLGAEAVVALYHPLLASEVQVPFSEGTEPAALIAPAGACDCHHHTYDSRIAAMPAGAVRRDATVADYRLLQKRIRTERNVVVTPSQYGFNNTVMLSALQQFGKNARGIAVVEASVSDAELKQLHEKGVRGIRFTPTADWDTVKILAKRVADLGWHIQFNLTRKQDLVDAENILRELPTNLVFDHFGRVNNVNDAVFGTISRLLEKGRTWIKFSGPYITSQTGAPSYADSVVVAKAYLRVARERMVWGTDWPHPSAKVVPNDARLFDLNMDWAPDEATRKLILVHNPEVLYGF